jgi:hypothetical protein
MALRRTGFKNRGTGLKRSGDGLKRGGPIKANGPTKSKRRSNALHGRAAAVAYMGAVAATGCALCRHLGLGATPGQVHHQRTGIGAGQRATDFQTVCLCDLHHEGKDGIHGMGRKAWEAKHGITELQLIEQTRHELAEQGVVYGDIA